MNNSHAHLFTINLQILILIIIKSLALYAKRKCVNKTQTYKYFRTKQQQYEM